jgi:hypothetical protein
MTINPSLITNLWADESEITRKKELATKFEEELDYIDMYFHSYIKPKYGEKLSATSSNSRWVPERGSSIGAGGIAMIVNNARRNTSEWDDIESFQSYRSFMPDDPTSGLATTYEDYDEEDNESFLDSLIEDYSEKLIKQIPPKNDIPVTRVTRRPVDYSPEHTRVNSPELSRVKTPDRAQVITPEPTIRVKITDQRIEQEQRVKLAVQTKSRSMEPMDFFDNAIDKFDLQFPGSLEPSKVANKYQ